MNDRVFVIDTNEDLLHSLKDLLEFYKFDVDISTSGKDALERISRYNYDVILSDIHLPSISGLELLDRVKQTINSEIPVILMTGKISIDLVIKSINLGAADFIKKPFNDYQIYKAITRQLHKRKRESFLNNSARFLMGTFYSFEFSAHDYLDFNITDFLVNHLIKLKDLTPTICNELSLIIEEMLSNAFIHGVFNIGSTFKTMSHSLYTETIERLLKDEIISDKKVFVNICYRKKAKVIMITVTDQGNGYDYETEKQVDAENIFRGLSLIRILADKVKIFNEGRTIRVEKRVTKKKSN